MWPAPAVLSMPWVFFSITSLVTLSEARSSTRSVTLVALRSVTSCEKREADFVASSLLVLNEASAEAEPEAPGT